MALNRPQKGHLFTEWELNQGRWWPCSTSAGDMPVGGLGLFFALQMSRNDCESARSIVMQGFQTRFREQANSEMESVGDYDGLCYPPQHFGGFIWLWWAGRRRT